MQGSASRLRAVCRTPLASVKSSSCPMGASSQIRTKFSYPRTTWSTRGAKKEIPVTLIPGDGIGPEVSYAVKGVIEAVGAPIDWEEFIIAPGTKVGKDVIASIANNNVCLKGPLYTPLSFSKRSDSRNVDLRKSLHLFANVVPVKSFPGVPRAHPDDLDMVIVRENTEGEYSGLEQEIAPGIVQSLKVTTMDASMRVAEFAFQWAIKHGRKKITAVHKANIQKLTDGLFLECCREVAKAYPEIQFEDMIIDNTCMQMVKNPAQFDVMLCPNLYGNLTANVATGLVGGPGMVPGINYATGGECVYEMGARHVAMDIEGAGIANPTAHMLAATLLLKKVDLDEEAADIEAALDRVYTREKLRTRDVGGLATTREFTSAVIEEILK